MKSIVLCDNSDPQRVLPFCEKYGLGIEIQGFYDPNALDSKNEQLAFHKSILPPHIEKHMHAPFWDLCLGSANMKIAEVTRFYFDYAYEIAEALDCKGITVHHGYVPHTSHPTNWIKRSVSFWQEFFLAHPGDINLYMENLCEQNTETMAGIIDAYQYDRLSINLDIGHAHCNSGMPVIDWVKQLNRRIKYVHLHQNNGVHDEHLGLHKGNMPIHDVLSALNEYAPDAIWALECNLDDIEASILFLETNGYFTRTHTYSNFD